MSQHEQQIPAGFETAHLDGFRCESFTDGDTVQLFLVEYRYAQPVGERRLLAHFVGENAQIESTRLQMLFDAALQYYQTGGKLSDGINCLQSLHMQLPEQLPADSHLLVFGYEHIVCSQIWELADGSLIRVVPDEFSECISLQDFSEAELPG